MIAGTPSGFRDILPQEALARERISGIVREVFSSHGYLPVETPLLESRDALERAGRIKGLPFQLFDVDGSLLTLRPDLTLPIARMVATRVSPDRLPVRLRYEAPVVREESSLKGQPRQFTQLGVELVGGDGAAAEHEVVDLLAETLVALDVPAWRIVLGSVKPLKALLDTCAPSARFREEALALVHDSDFVSLDELVEKAAAAGELEPAAARAICRIPRLVGGTEVVPALNALLVVIFVSIFV